MAVDENNKNCKMYEPVTESAKTEDSERCSWSPFQCEACGMCYKSERSIRKHTINVHGRKWRRSGLTLELTPEEVAAERQKMSVLRTQSKQRLKMRTNPEFAAKFVGEKSVGDVNNDATTMATSSIGTVENVRQKSIWESLHIDCKVCGKSYRGERSFRKHMIGAHGQRWTRSGTTFELTEEELERERGKLCLSHLSRNERRRMRARLNSELAAELEGRESTSAAEASGTSTAESVVQSLAMDCETERCSDVQEGNINGVGYCKSDWEAENVLLEAAAKGDEQKVWELVAASGTQSGSLVNAQHSVNGWTALHWACKRGQTDIVKILLSVGADPATKTNNGETCLQLAAKDEIRVLLGGLSSSLDLDIKEESSNDEPQFVPNYRNSHTKIPYGTRSKTITNATTPGETYTNGVITTACDEIILKVRFDSSPDFIEIDVPCRKIKTIRGIETTCSLTYEDLIKLICREFQVGRKRIRKLRKLPNTLVRNDRDARRLKDFQELEIIEFE